MSTWFCKQSKSVHSYCLALRSSQNISYLPLVLCKSRATHELFFQFIHSLHPFLRLPHVFNREYFRGEDGQEVEISMMHTTDYVPYYNDASDKYEVVGIPYQNKEYYMYLVLPYESESLKYFSDIFTYEHINHIVRDSVVSKVDIKLPIMRLRTSNRMKESLGQMGIRYLFESADLSNMLTESQLKVSEIWHHVDIDVNEKGAAFSAGTTQEYKVYSEHVPEQDAEQQFYVQRPYMFFIYHPETHTVLFYGSINKLSNY